MLSAIEDEYYRPIVDFNSETGICTIEGESYLEETDDFFLPLISWLKEFTSSSNKDIVFNFKLTYYNTSTSKKLLEFLKILKEYINKGNKATINWYYEENDTDIIEDAEDFMVITGLKFNLNKF
jgi:hypothetical protein